MEQDDAPNPVGSSYIDSWYGYVHDLTSVLGTKQQSDGYANHYCGGGRGGGGGASLWAALDAAGNGLATAQGSDPTAWRSNATDERIQFAPGILR